MAFWNLFKKKNNKIRLIETNQQAQDVYGQAQSLYDKGDFTGAIVLYDSLLDSGHGNQYDLRLVRLQAYCKAARFSEAEQEAKQLLDVLKMGGAPVASSRVIYWYLLARYGGDEKKAMDEFVKL